MALGFVQGNFVERNSSGTVNTKTFTSNVTAGNIIVAFLWTGTGGGGVAFTQSAGTASVTWNGAGGVSNGTGSGAGTLYANDSLVNTTGSCTITATLNSSQPNGLLLIGEFNVGGHSLVRDATNVANTQSPATTSFQSGSITTTNNPAVLICWYDNNGTTTAFTGGITSGWAENVWDSGYQSGFASASVTTPASYSLAATQISGTTDSVIYAYQATTVTVTPVNATASLAGAGVYSHGGRLINNASVSI